MSPPTFKLKTNNCYVLTEVKRNQTYEVKRNLAYEDPPHTYEEIAELKVP